MAWGGRPPAERSDYRERPTESTGSPQRRSERGLRGFRRDLRARLLRARGRPPTQVAAELFSASRKGPGAAASESGSAPARHVYLERQEGGGSPMPEDLHSTWERVRLALRQQVTDLTFHIWLEPLELAAREPGRLFVRAPGHIRTWVEERYVPVLASAAQEALSGRHAIEIVGEDWLPPGSSVGVPGLPSAGQSEPDVVLNPKYTFDQFVIGDCNRLAHAAALAVAEQPGQAYNPLFLHGQPGLGKTHLLHAIGHYVGMHGHGMRVRHATVEEFTNAFVQAARRGDTDAFKERFRGTDVLLIDDIQFLGGKVQTKEEFFHTFNALYDAGGQLVITSDRAPGEMLDFESRLVERFKSGLVADLEPPDYDLRLTILRKRASVDALTEVSEETLAEVAAHAIGSVRALEGALIRVVAYASVRGQRASPELARELLARLYPEARRRAAVEDIQAAVAETFAIDRAMLVSHDRRPRVALARQIAIYLARELTGDSLPSIGRAFGGRDHSTILYAHRRIAARLPADPEVDTTVKTLTKRLAGGS